MVKTSPSNIGSAGSIPGWGAGIPHALRPKKPQQNQGVEQRQYCDRTLKMVHIKKIFKKKETKLRNSFIVKIKSRVLPEKNKKW